ncbi:MAG: hypothetical protein NTW19_18680 [Planctomycetota bacterium]|nr:hypothetical protein [Planctomycetota bacterium]
MARFLTITSSTLGKWGQRYWIWSVLWMSPLAVISVFSHNPLSNEPRNPLWYSLFLVCILVLGAPWFVPLAMVGLCLIAYMYEDTYSMLLMAVGYSAGVAAATAAAIAAFHWAQRRRRSIRERVREEPDALGP